MQLAGNFPETCSGVVRNLTCLKLAVGRGVVSTLLLAWCGQVVAFVMNNARRVLGVDAARVLAVSARSALGAKLAAAGGGGGFFAGLWGAPAFRLLDWPMGCASGAGFHSFLTVLGWRRASSIEALRHSSTVMKECINPFFIWC